MALRDSSTATPEAIQSLAERNLEMAVRIKTLEGMIQGLMDAMKPLLDEWTRLQDEARPPEGSA